MHQAEKRRFIYASTYTSLLFEIAYDKIDRQNEIIEKKKELLNSDINETKNIGGLDQNGMELMWWPTQNVTKYPCKLPFILFYFVFVENNKSYKMCHPDNDWHPAADEMKLKQAPITAIVSILLNETTNKGKNAKKTVFFCLLAIR